MYRKRSICRPGGAAFSKRGAVILRPTVKLLLPSKT